MDTTNVFKNKMNFKSRNWFTKETWKFDVVWVLAWVAIIGVLLRETSHFIHFLIWQYLDLKAKGI